MIPGVYMNKFVPIVLIAAALSGCAGMQRITTYKGQADASFEVQGYRYTAWAHPSEDAILVQLSMKTSAINGFVRGGQPGLAEFQSAANAIALPVGCTVRDLKPLIRSTAWEFSYDCPAGIDLAKLVETQRERLKQGLPLERP